MTKIKMTLPSIRVVAFPPRLRVVSFAVAIVGASLLTGCAFNNSPRDEADAQSAANKGNWPVEIKDSENAYAEHPDIINEFNLATGYENTGQNAKATALYRDLMTTGQETQLNPSRNDDGSAVAPSDGNIADESARRIELMAGRPSAVDDYPEMSR